MPDVNGDHPVPRAFLEQMGAYMDDQPEWRDSLLGDELRAELAERWANKDANRSKLVERLADRKPDAGSRLAEAVVARWGQHSRLHPEDEMLLNLARDVLAPPLQPPLQIVDLPDTVPYGGRGAVHLDGCEDMMNVDHQVPNCRVQTIPEHHRMPGGDLTSEACAKLRSVLQDDKLGVFCGQPAVADVQDTDGVWKPMCVLCSDGFPDTRIDVGPYL